MDSRTSRGRGVPSDLGASLCSTAWMEVDGWVPAVTGVGEDATTRSESRSSGFTAGISSDVFESSKEIRGRVEFEPKMHADCNHIVSKAKRRFSGLNDSHFPQGDPAASETGRHAVGGCPHYLRLLLCRS